MSTNNILEGGLQVNGISVIYFGQTPSGPGSVGFGPYNGAPNQPLNFFGPANSDVNGIATELKPSPEYRGSSGVEGNLMTATPLPPKSGTNP